MREVCLVGSQVIWVGVGGSSGVFGLIAPTQKLPGP
jgi:hypothetical protein